MVKVIVVNGRPQCGKTTFETNCADLSTESCMVHLISTIDYVKNCACKLGWNGEKTPEARYFLSELKRIMTLYNDSPYQQVTKEIKKYEEDNKTHIFFVDCREPLEIFRFKRDYGAMAVLVRRPEADQQKVSNFSDASVYNFNYDLIIENNSDFNQLKESAKTFMEMITKENENGKLGN